MVDRDAHFTQQLPSLVRFQARQLLLHHDELELPLRRVVDQVGRFGSTVGVRSAGAFLIVWSPMSIPKWFPSVTASGT
jgi:hypothetical protein